MRTKLIILLLILFYNMGRAQNARQFQNPSDDYRPWIFWDWVNDMVSKKGITSDLEQFKKFGLSGTLIMLVGSETNNRQMWSNHHMPNPIVSQTPEFFQTWKFAAEESARLGLTISTQCGPGWCHSGGPWIKPDQAVQHIAYSEVPVVGEGKTITLRLDEKPTHEANSYSLPQPGADDYTADISTVAFPDKKEIALEEIVDLSNRANQGKIEWTVPPGKWIIRRYAIRNARAYNRPAPIGGKGFECDKLDKDAVDSMFNGMIGRYLQDSPALVGKTIRAFEADSWEVGNPEWSAKFKAEFIKRRGYDPTPWLISYKSDQVVGSAELTRRFQNDLYLTQTDLFAENFFTHLSNKADSLGMEFMTEPYTGPFDPIRMAGRVQVPMGEFWVSTERMNTVRWAASAANTYGRKVAAAEAFTGRWNDGNWQMDPYAIKRVGDLAFCNGLNKMVLHGTALQPWGMDWRPGMNMFFWGTMFVPGQTWWGPGRAWVNYISRCQYVLQQGINVADVVGLMPTLNWKGAMPGGLHKLYNYDLVTEETLVKDMDFSDGYFNLPSGARYKVLFLPKTGGTIDLDILEKLVALVQKGGIVVCEDKPVHAPGLSGYPQVDGKVAQLVAKLWGDSDGQTVTEHVLGEGKLVWMHEIWRDTFDAERNYFLQTRTKDRAFWEDPAKTLRWSAPFLSLLRKLAHPDVEVLSASGEAFAWGGMPKTAAGQRRGEDAIAWTHRQKGDTDIYFISNQTETANQAELLFRVKNKVPVLWDPETGKQYRTTQWSADGDRTRITLPLTPFGAVFVLFKPKNEVPANLLPYREEHFTQQIPITGTWAVRFPKGLGAPAHAELTTGSWTENATFGIKYFSGTATYTKAVNLTKQQLRSGIMLDLGRVKHLAEIEVNGRVADTLWKPPFRSDIGALLKPGRNTITIKVTNTWWNRMVGDEQLPEDLEWLPKLRYAGEDYKGYELKEFPAWVWRGGPRPSKDRVTFTPWRFVEKDSPLQEAGLIGPVSLVLYEQ